MGWKTISEVLLDDDLDGTSLRVANRVKFHDDVIITTIRAWFVVFNDPTFTNLSMKIYSDDNGVPKKLLHTSTNVVTKAQLITDLSGYKEAPFNFNEPVFNGNDWYHLVPFATGYTYSSSAWLGWMKDWPDPVYRLNAFDGPNDAGRAAYRAYYLGSYL